MDNRRHCRQVLVIHGDTITSFWHLPFLLLSLIGQLYCFSQLLQTNQNVSLRGQFVIKYKMAPGLVTSMKRFPRNQLAYERHHGLKACYLSSQLQKQQLMISLIITRSNNAPTGRSWALFEQRFGKSLSAQPSNTSRS